MAGFLTSGRVWRGARGPAVAAAALVLAAIPIVNAPSKPLDLQPFPDAAEYADAALQLASGKGYVTFAHGDEAQPPRYPPGFSAVLAPFVKWGGAFPESAQRGSKSIVVLLLLAIWTAAYLIGGPPAALIAALLFAASPFFTTAAGLVMSDALGALLTVVSVALVARPSRLTAAASGFFAGAAVTVRLAALASLVGLALGFERRRLAGLALVVSVPFLAFLLVFQWTSLGHPLRTGYDYYFPDLQEFDLGYVTRDDPQGDGPWVVDDRLHGRLMEWTCPCPQGGAMSNLANIVFYPAVALGAFWIYTPPFVSLFAAWELLRRRRSAIGRYVALVIASNIVLFAFYFYQAARFLAPVGALLIVFSAVGLAGAGGRAWQRVHPRARPGSAFR